MSTLIIESLTLDDTGDIKAVGTNGAGEASATVKLNVIGRQLQNRHTNTPCD